MRYLRKSPQKGQALIEFALILPIFLLMLLIIFDLGRVVYYYSAVHNAAREGARYGAVPGNTSPPGSIRAAAINLTAGMDIPEGDIGVTSVVTDTVQVTVVYTFTPATPILSILTGSPDIVLSSISTMQIEPR